MTKQVILDILKEVYYTIVVHLVKTLYDFQQIDSFFSNIRFCWLVPPEPLLLEKRNTPHSKALTFIKLYLPTHEHSIIMP